MNSNVSEFIGLLGTIVILAGVSVAIINGRKTALIIQRAGNAFTKSIRAATLQ